MVISIPCSNYKFVKSVFLVLWPPKKNVVNLFTIFSLPHLKAKVIIITSTLSHVRKSDTNSLIRNSSFCELVTLVI